MSVPPAYAVLNAEVLVCLGYEIDSAFVRMKQYLSTTDVAEALAFVTRHWKAHNIRVALLIGDAFARENTRACRGLVQALQQQQRVAMINQMTVEATEEAHALNFARNLLRLRELSWASGKLSATVPAFVVSGGPGLDRNGHLLPEAAKRGIVIAVNTSAGAVMRRGVCPDAVVVIEAKDSAEVTEGLRRAPSSMHVLSLASGQQNFEVDSSHKALIAQYHPGTVDSVLATGGTPLAYGGNCVSAATALALHWGCDPIVHVGASHCYLPNRGVYARGTPFEDLRWELRERRVLQHYSTQEQPSKVLPDAEPIEARDCGGRDDVLTTTSLWGFASWLIESARDNPQWNATEHGVHLDGMRHLTLQEAIDELPVRQEVSAGEPGKLGGLVKPHGVEQEIERLRAGLQAVADEPRSMGLALAVERCPIVNAWVITEGIRMRTTGGVTAPEMVRRMNEAARRGARELLEVLG